MKKTTATKGYPCGLCGQSFFPVWKNVTAWVVVSKEDKVWMRTREDKCPFCECDILDHEMKKSKKKPRS